MKWPDDYINKIICGDCLEVMKGIPDESVDLILTDPPYDLHADSRGGLHNKRDWLKNVHEDGLDNFHPEIFWNIAKGKMKKTNAYIFTSKNLLSSYLTLFEKTYNWELIIYAKNNPIPTKNNKYLSDKEYMFFIREKGSFFNNNLPYPYYYTVKTVNVSPSINQHPTEKNVAVIKQLIEMSTRVGDVVLDPFLGSGTTAVACKDLDRKFIGIEISEKYCEIARKRVERYIPNLRLFS